MAEHPAFVVSPHGLRIKGMVSITWSERVCGKNGCYRVDRKAAEAVYNESRSRGIPVALVNYGTDSGDLSTLQLDWGSEIPLSFTGARSVVIATPARDMKNEDLVKFGETLADVLEGYEQGYTIIISADQAHTHYANGPYGYSPLAKAFDAQVIRIVRSNRLEELLEIERRTIEEARPDSYWQMLVMLGILRRVRFDVESLAYQVAGYYGMLAACYRRE